MPRIEIRDLTKVFYPARTLGAWLRAPWRPGAPITALHHVSLVIEPEQVCCVMGPNGAGKTTLLKILAGLLVPTSGMVTIPSGSTRTDVGFVFGERAGFYDRLTGRQNLEFFAALQELSPDASRRKLEELFETLRIAQPDRQYQEYSTGIKQRLHLARALLHEPSLLLLDEPTKSLDPAQTERVRAFLRDWLKGEAGRTVILTTHSVSEAEQLAQRLVVLQSGSPRFAGTVDDFKAQGGIDAMLGRS